MYSWNHMQPTPQRGRTLFLEVPRLWVPMHEAIRIAAPKTPEGALIWKMHDDAYETERTAMMLVNFGRSITGDAAIEWGERHWMKLSSFRDVCALSAHMPELYRTLGTDPAGIVATREQEHEGIWRAGCIWLGSVQHEAAYIPTRYPLHDSYWFLFL